MWDEGKGEFSPDSIYFPTFSAVAQASDFLDYAQILWKTKLHVKTIIRLESSCTQLFRCEKIDLVFCSPYPDE
jgi:hypothetical protein